MGLGTEDEVEAEEHVTQADAALAKGEIVGAACSGVRDCDETGRAIRRLGLWDSARIGARAASEVPWWLASVVTDSRDTMVCG